MFARPASLPALLPNVPPGQNMASAGFRSLKKWLRKIGTSKERGVGFEDLNSVLHASRRRCRAFSSSTLEPSTPHGLLHNYSVTVCYTNFILLLHSRRTA